MLHLLKTCLTVIKKKLEQTTKQKNTTKTKNKTNKQKQTKNPVLYQHNLDAMLFKMFVCQRQEESSEKSKV